MNHDVEKVRENTNAFVQKLTKKYDSIILRYSIVEPKFITAKFI